MQNTFVTAPPLLRNTLGAAQGDFVVAEWHDAGGPAGEPRYIAPLHTHYSDDEAWYVIEGCLHIRSGDEIIEARQGTAVMVSKGTPHTFWNPLETKTRYLMIMTPNIFQLVDSLHKLEERTQERLQEVFREFDSELN